MAEKLLIALNCEKESAEKMLWQLQQEGLDISGYSISRSIENIRQVLGAPDCNVTILIVPYLLRDNQCITVKELDELRTMNEKILFSRLYLMCCMEQIMFRDFLILGFIMRYLIRILHRKLL